MKHIITLIFAIIIMSTQSLFAQENASTVEITQEDITNYPQSTSENISVWGIKLGMSANEVAEQLSNYEKVVAYIDDMHTTEDLRVYVNYKEYPEGEEEEMLYLIWEENKGVLTQISFFEDFNRFLVGLSKDLMTTNSFESGSDINTKYLGNYDKEEVTLDMPSISLKHTTYTYIKKGLKITHKENSDGTSVVFSIIKE